MGSSDNINGMKAQDWKKLDTSSIVATSKQPYGLSPEQLQLLNAFTNVIAAAAQDIHGTAANDKYKYIVDLIIRRSKQVVSDDGNNVVNDIKEALERKDESALAEIVKKLDALDAKVIKQSTDSAIATTSFDDDFSDKLAQRTTDAVIANVSKQLGSLKEAMQSMFTGQPAKSIEAKREVNKAQVKTASSTKASKINTTNVIDKLLSNGKRFKSNSIVTAKIAQLGTDTAGVISVLQDKNVLKKSIEQTAAKISGTLDTTKDKEDKDDTAKEKNKEKEEENSIGKFISNVIVKPTMKVLKTIGGMLSKLSKAVFKRLSTPIFHLLKSPAGMYALGFVAGYVWTRWLGPFWNTVIKPFFSDVVGPLLDKILPLFGPDGLVSKMIDLFKPGGMMSSIAKFLGYQSGGGPDTAGSWLSVVKNIVKINTSAISGVGKTTGFIFNKVAKLFRGKNVDIATKAAEKAKLLKKTGDTAEILKEAKKAKQAADELKKAADLAKGSKNYAKIAKEQKQAAAAYARTMKYFNEAKALNKNQSLGAKLSKAVVGRISKFLGVDGVIKAAGKIGTKGGTARFIGHSVAMATGLTPTLKAVGKTAKVAGKAVKFGVKAMPFVGTAATVGLNAMEYKALKNEAEEMCKKYKQKTLSDILLASGFKDKDGNDITEEVHFQAQNLMQAIDFKMRTSITDAALEGLDYIIPGVGTALQIGTNAFMNNMKAADKERRRGVMEANKTTRAYVKSAKEQLAMSLEIKNKINDMQNADEKQAAMKERLKKLQQAKSIYRKLDELEKEATDKYQDLNTGWTSVFSSSENIKFWQEKMDDARQRKMKLLKENGFIAGDLKDEILAHDTDDMNEEQRQAKALLEMELQNTGDVSEETYDMYAKAFGIKGGYAKNKNTLIENKFGQIKREFDALHPQEMQQEMMSSLDESLQMQSEMQQQALGAIASGNEKLINAMQESSESQQQANTQILESLDSLKQMIQTNTLTTSNVTNVVAAPARQNMASIENGRQQQIY